MSETKTAGQVNAEALGWNWDCVFDHQMESFEAAAQAVIAHHEATRPAWPPMRPMSDKLPKRFIVAIKTEKIGEPGVAGEPRIELANLHWSGSAICLDYGGGTYDIDSVLLLGWWPLPPLEGLKA